MIDDPVVDAARAPMPITVRIPEACRLTGIGRSKLYELIAAGQIEIVKVPPPDPTLARDVRRG
jgi:predicted DNA-binding transcriptional regulator AlpA